MSYDFNIDEVLKMAEQIEINGARFYRQMADAISVDPLRQLFFDFAKMEEQHQKVFASMRSDLSDKEREPTVFDPEGETALYLKALADVRVFEQNAEEEFLLSDDLSEKEKVKRIFRAAINREKESIVFYLGMKELVPKNFGKDKIDAVIKEEMKHIRLLGSRFVSLK
jgi:rubrerythrin